MPIDTLKASKRLQEEGTFSPEQAERIAEILSDLDVASVTKEDLDAVEERLGARIDQVETRVDSLETRMEERFQQVDERFDQLDSRLTQRIELSEQRTEKQISQLRTDLYRGLFLGVGAVAALVTVPGYLLGEYLLFANRRPLP